MKMWSRSWWCAFSRLAGPKVLALDRTNWKLGSRDVEHPGPRHRDATVPRAVDVEPARPRGQLVNGTTHRVDASLPAPVRGVISGLMPCSPTGEFVGARWLEFLNENNVPFVVRLRENLQVHTEDDGMLRLFRTLVHKSRRGSKRDWTGWLHTMTERPENRLKFAAKRIRGKESLIIATNIGAPPERPAPLSASLGYRMPLLGRQDPWLQHRGYPHHRFRQTRHPPRHRHPRRDVGTPLRDPGDGAQANPPEDAQTAREVLVPNRVRCSAEVDHLRLRMTHSWHGKRPSRNDRSIYPKSSESCYCIHFCGRRG